MCIFNSRIIIIVSHGGVYTCSYFSLLPEFSLPTGSSDEAMRELLSDGTVLCRIVNTLIPGVLEVSHLLLDNVGSFFLVESLC
jgi:hypothetical protein